MPTAALTGRPPTRRPSPYEGPYDQTAGRNGPYGKGRSLPEGPGSFMGLGPFTERPLITGKLTGSYGEGFCQNWAGISACVP